mmetsp:Transcript_16132/g.37766  ORF Transcript_16132/g.37766 Transcript_16132/m.37766 type:complete len:461 (-) Transcript_16132:54-1436(-)
MAATAELCCMPISEISSYVQRWTIRARVTSKSQIRTFSKGASTGKVFDISLLDAHGGEIRASFFNDAAGEFHERLQTGKCYTFSRGSVRIADSRFNQCKHRYDLVFDKLAQVEEVDDDAQIEAVKFHFSELRSLQSRQLPCNVDVCGVVTGPGSVISFTSKEGRDLVKRDITIADDTATTMVVTIWGDRAKQADKDFADHPVIGLKGVQVKEWNGGRSGSLSEGGALVLQLQTPEGKRLQQWWASGGSTQSLTALSHAGGFTSSTGGKAAADLAELRRLSEQVLEKPQHFSVVCRLAMVQTMKRGEAQPLVYSACQEPKEGKMLPCNRRVDSSGFCASCNRAGRVALRFNLRCRFADQGDAAWLTTFHEAAQQVLGLSAERANELEQGEGGREALEAAIANCYFRQPLRLTMRAKLESFQGETRTGITCIDARPVPRGERGRAMLKEIREGLADTVTPLL